MVGGFLGGFFSPLLLSRISRSMIDLVRAVMMLLVYFFYQGRNMWSKNVIDRSVTVKRTILLYELIMAWGMDDRWVANRCL